MKMSEGIAALFKRKFSRIDEILKSKPTTGKCYYLDDNQRKIFYLVTKQNFYDKSNYSDLESSLKNLNRLCDRFKIARLAMPKIGCGLDKLNWDIVAKIIDIVFNTSTTQKTVYFRHSLFNLTTQPSVNDSDTIKKITADNIRNTTDFNYVNLRCRWLTEPS
jgi:hypothetical protein